MGLINSIVSFSYRVLKLEDQQEMDSERDLLLKEFISLKTRYFEPKAMQQLPDYVRKKHLINSLTFTKRDGTVIMSTEEDAFKGAMVGSSLFKYLLSELPDSRYLMVKRENWHIVYAKKEYLIVIEANDVLASIEIEAIAKDIEKHINKLEYKY
ncbi:MAG: hypothetical protein J7K00_05185 [Candidatus Diapherotrites archaeon]|nr:hypothetical protein [Candidatus Diapherotrites archaeon]